MYTHDGYRTILEEELLKSYVPIECAYAVGIVLDQTYGYLNREGGYQVHHTLVDIYSLEDAERVRDEYNGDFIEAVIDEKEFRSREPMWGPFEHCDECVAEGWFDGSRRDTEQAHR